MNPGSSTFEINFNTKEGLETKGHLQLLWNLIQKYKVDIFEVSLTRITDDFIAYITINHIDIDEEGSFISMATKLLHYKSKLLLPVNHTDEDLSEIDVLPQDLVDQLIEYRTFQLITESFITMQDKVNLSIAKEPEWSQYEENIDFLHVSFNQFLSVFQEFLNKELITSPIQFPEEDVIVENLIADIETFIFQNKIVSFLELIKNESPYKKIGYFLAVLEMILRKKIKVSQSSLNGDIELKQI